MKLAVIGSRKFTNYLFLQRVIRNKFILSKIECIVSGGAKGTDILAELFADTYGIPKKIFYPEWKVYGKRAGFIRNEYIIEYADEVIAFWNGNSKGTKNSIDIAKRLKKKIYIIYVKGKVKWKKKLKD